MEDVMSEHENKAHEVELRKNLQPRAPDDGQANTRPQAPTSEGRPAKPNPSGD